LIVENAFLKLPELLTSSFDHSDTFESTVVHLLAVAVLMELNSRNVERPFEHVFTEKPYSVKDKDGRPIQADMLIKLEGAVPTRGRMELYGVREQNWIEVKAFLSSVRRGSPPPTTANAGRVLRDLLRLCLLPEELQGGIRQNGRYLLVVFACPPPQSIAMQSRSGDRVWLSRLFTEGYTDLKFDLSDEPKTLREAVGPGFIRFPSLQGSLKLRTMMFQPEGNKNDPLFWGYLARIRYFQIGISGLEIEYEDEPGQYWDKYHVCQLKKVRQEIIARF